MTEGNLGKHFFVSGMSLGNWAGKAFYAALLKHDIKTISHVQYNLSFMPKMLMLSTENNHHSICTNKNHIYTKCIYRVITTVYMEQYKA